MQYSNSDKQLLKENKCPVLAKITLLDDNSVFTEDDYITDFTYKDFRYVPNNGFIGQFVERTLDGNFKNLPADKIFENQEINLQLGIVNTSDNDSTTWYDYGNFLITKVQATDTTGKYKFESADYTKKFNKNFDGNYTDATYTKSFNEKMEDEESVTALWLARYVCAQAGVQLYTTTFTNSNFVITSNQYDSDETLRKVMQDIGKLAYSWVRIAEDNKVHIDFTPKSTSSVNQYDQLTVDEYYTSKKSDLTFGPVNKVLIGMSAVDGENMYETSPEYTPETECAIKIWDNNLTNTDELRALALNGCDRLFGITYTPVTIDTIGHPWLEGDELIKLTNVDNEVLYTYPFNRTIEYKGYINTTLSSEALTAQANKYEYKNDIISSVKKTSIEVDKANQRINLLAEDVGENTSRLSSLTITVDGIEGRVGDIETTEVVAVTNQYAVNTDPSNPPAESSSSWSETKPTRGEGQYIWARIKSTYKSGDIQYSNPVNTTGDKGDSGIPGPQGDDGASIDTVTNYYAVSQYNDYEHVPTNWTTDLSSIELTETNKYLWSYDEITYTEGKQATETGARVIGVYGDKGNPGTNGQPGADGRGISSIVNYYLATDKSSGVTRSTTGWTTTYQNMTEQKPYLWNYQKLTYTKGTTTQYVEPMIIGVYGLPGSDGKGIKSITDIYYVTSSSSAPNKPTSHVTTSSLVAYDTWNLQCPSYTTTYEYFYTCSEVLYSDDTYGWTNVVNNQALMFANQNAYNANETANSANTTAVSANTTANTALTTINNLQIGGTNLLENSSANLGDKSNWSSDSDSMTVYSSGGYMNLPYFRYEKNLTSASSRSFLINTTVHSKLNVNDNIIISGYYRNHAGVATTFQVWIRFSSGGEKYVSTYVTTNTTEEWTYFEAKGTITNIPYATTIYPQFQIAFNNGERHNIDFCAIKVEKGTKHTSWSPAPEDTNTTISSLNTYVDTNIQNLQNQIDGAIQFWNGANIPTLSNYPASDWTTEDARIAHQADIYTVIQDVSGELKQGKSYRFDKVNGTWQWIELTDNELSAVQALASSKAKVFVTTPTVPYNIGDLWLNNNKLYRCKTAKTASQSYSSSDWELATDYTNDDKANQALNKINTLEIGNRNYADDTSDEWESFNITDGTNKTAMLFNNCDFINKGLVAGDTLRLSFKIKFSDDFSYTGTGTQQSRIQGNRNIGGTWTNISVTGGDQTSAIIDIIDSDKKEGEIRTYLTLPSNFGNGTYTEVSMMNIRFDYYSGTCYIKDVMLAKGDKYLDWTPAPEDVDTDVNKSQELIVGTQTAQTYSWTGATSYYKTIKDGDSILYFLPYNSGGSGVSYNIENVTAGTTSTNSGAVLNLTLANGSTTGNVPLYYRGTERVGTQYVYGSMIRLTYRSPYVLNSSNTQQYRVDKAWVADANYNSDTYDRIRFNQAITAGEAITSGQLLAKVGTSFKKLVTGLAFDVTQPIILAGANINNGATSNNTYLSHPSVNLRNTVSGISITNKQTCYLVGTLSGSTFTTKSSNMLTTTIPTAEDDYYYMSLGYMYSSYQMILFPEHPLFKFIDGQFKSLNQVAYDAQINLDNLEIGGRNILRDTKAFSNTNVANTESGYLRSRGVVTTDETFEGFTVVMRPSTSTGIIGEWLVTDCKNGESYTLSFWVKGDGRPICYFYGPSGFIRVDKVITQNGTGNSSDGNSDSGAHGVPVSDTEWQRVWVTWVLKDTGGTTSDKYALIRNDNGANVYVAGVKLEKGNKATDWTPAPEDVANDIAEINNSLSHYITKTTYDSDWQVRKDEIYGVVSKDFVATDEFKSYKTTTATEISGKADSVEISAIATQTVNDVVGLDNEGNPIVGGYAETISDVKNTFNFSTNGLEIARTGNTMSLLLQNDRLSFMNSGVEKAYMNSNSFVLSELTQLQLGNYAFVVRQNGSIDFKLIQKKEE